MSELPSFSELLARRDAPPGSAWGIFGAGDQIGTFNLLTPERVKAAAGLVRQGRLFPLNAPLDVISPCAWRPSPIRHHLGGGGATGRDDYLDRFYLQGSSQWDGLRHTSHPQHRFYNGVSAEQVDSASGDRLGVQNWAERGIAGRGVLLDVQRFLAQRGDPLDLESERPITPQLLDEIAEAHGVTIETGDILLLHTGWLAWYRTWPQSRKDALAWQSLSSPGLAPTQEMAGWIWDHHLAAVAADNLSVEAMPLHLEPERFLHYWLQPMFGMAIGELWHLDDLASACAEDGNASFFLVSQPLNVRGGVGSPPNAVAIK